MADLSNLVYEPSEGDLEAWNIDFELLIPNDLQRHRFQGRFFMPEGYEQALAVFYQLWKEPRKHFKWSMLGFERASLPYFMETPFFRIEAQYLDSGTEAYFEVAALKPALKKGFFADYKPDYDNTWYKTEDYNPNPYPSHQSYARRPIVLLDISRMSEEVQDFLALKTDLDFLGCKIVSPQGKEYKLYSELTCYEY
ncbi:hypothetical protein C4573_05615 [Candidatus Woesearchaeota archaeon]|nr:MAG: hypothetical protein C4573_05615 [Candidatus Woesearchaeota archaeon]